MNGARQHVAPATTTPSTSRSSRSAAVKRDSLTAELERGSYSQIFTHPGVDIPIPDPQFSAAKRQQRTNAFTSNMAHASLERQLLQARSEKVELEAKLRERDSTIERLEGDRRLLASREQSEREDKEQEQAARENDKVRQLVADHCTCDLISCPLPQLSFQTEIQRLRASLLRLEEDKSNSDDVHSQLSRSTNQTINGQKSQLAESTRQAKFFEDESIRWKRIAEEGTQRLRELEEENDALKSRKVSEGSAVTDPSTDNDWKVVRDELTRQAAYLRTLESSNARMTGELTQLRQRNESIEVLKEQKRDLERKLANTDSLRQSVVRLEAEVEAARKEREEW